jgi:hypothetical protein
MSADMLISSVIGLLSFQLPLLIVASVGLWFSVARRKHLARVSVLAGWGFGLLIVYSLASAVLVVVPALQYRFATSTESVRALTESLAWLQLLARATGPLFILGAALIARAVFLDRDTSVGRGPPPKNQISRHVLMVVLAPGIAAALISIVSLVQGSSYIFVPMYFVFSYLYGLVPAALIVYLLNRMNLHKLWHYAVAGLAVAVVSTGIFVLATYRTGTPSVEFYFQQFTEYLEFLFIGPLAGAAIWIIANKLRLFIDLP